MIIAIFTLIMTVYLARVASNISAEANRLAELEAPLLLATSINEAQLGHYYFRIESNPHNPLIINNVEWSASIDVSVLTGNIFSIGVVVPRSYTTHRIIPMPDDAFSAIGGSVTPGNSITITVNEPLIMTPNNHFAYIFLYAIDGNGRVVTAMQIYKNDNGNLVSHKRMFYNLILAGGNNWIYEIWENPSDSIFYDVNIITEHFREVHRLLNEYR